MTGQYGKAGYRSGCGSPFTQSCERHWVAVKKILAYLNATRDLGITYERGSRLSLVVFADADYASKATDRRSVSGAVVMLGGSVVCAISRT